MKNLTTTFGLFGAVIIAVGAVFKTLHYPGSAILLIVGAVLLFVYAVISMTEKSKKVQDPPGKAYVVVFGITGLVMLVAFLFKALHWPGAGKLIYAFLVAYVILLVTAVIRVLQEKDPAEKTGYTHNFILLLGAGSILIYPALFMLLNP